MPNVRSRTLSDDDDTEGFQLGLPSEYTKEQRVSLGLDTLAAVEMEIRQGEAHEVLEELRGVVTYLILFLQGKRSLRSQGMHTRAARRLREIEEERDLSMAKYRHSRKWMVSLGLSASDKVFLELRKEDTFRKMTQTKKLGDGSVNEGWIWHTGPISSIAKDMRTEWEEDRESLFAPSVLLLTHSPEKRVQWFRARREKEEWAEEVEILQAEFRRTYQSFQKYSTIWKSLAEKSAKIGYKAYAFQKADMFSTMATRCDAAWTSLEAKSLALVCI